MRAALCIAFAVVFMTEVVDSAKLREISDPNTFTALAYAPPAQAEGSTEALPLLLYLHGAGESGSNVRDLISPGATGTPPVALEDGSALGVLAKRFAVVAPQTDHGWRPQEIGRFLDFLLSGKAAHGLPPIDAKRCYVTGHSMGGGGALVAATLGRFAAAVPVAAAGYPTGHQAFNALATVPLWLFHGRNDVVVPSSVSERVIEKLRAAGANESSARITLYGLLPACSNPPRNPLAAIPRGRVRLSVRRQRACACGMARLRRSR